MITTTQRLAVQAKAGASRELLELVAEQALVGGFGSVPIDAGDRA